MQNQTISIRRSVERKVPGYVKIIAFLLYAAALLFTILGAMFGILFLPLALGSLFGGWYLMGEARVIYEYRLDGKTLTVMRTSGMRSRQKEIEFFTLDLNELIVVADEGTQSMQDAEKLTRQGERKRVCYDISAQDPNRACAFLYAKGSGADSGRFVRVCFLPYPDFVGAIRRLCPFPAVSGFCGRDTEALPRKGDDDRWRDMKTKRRA